MLKRITFFIKSFFYKKIPFRCNTLSLVTKMFVTCNRSSKAQKKFNISSYGFKKINVLDGQLLVIFCSLVKSFVQIFLIIKFELVSEWKHAIIRPPSLKGPFDTKSISLCFFRKTQQRTERCSLPVYLSHSWVILIFQRDRTWCK